jgi:hypothetical protein
VKAALPADSTPLSDLQVTSSDDSVVAITVVLNPQPKYASEDLQPIIDAITDQFQQASIGQATALTFQWSPDDVGPDSSEPDVDSAGGGGQSDSNPPSG